MWKITFDTSIGSYINGVNQLTVFVLKNNLTHGCGLYIESFAVQYCGLITLSEFWLVFVTLSERM